MIRLLALQKAADRIAATSGFEKCMIGRQHPSCVDAFCGAMNASDSGFSRSDKSAC
jgi:hypothetical protein